MTMRHCSSFFYPQHAIHALLHPPQLLIIRLSRFVATRRSYRKHTGLVRWGSTVNVPFFRGLHTARAGDRISNFGCGMS